MKKRLILCLAIVLSFPGISLSQTQLERSEIKGNYNLLETSKLVLKVQSSMINSYDRALKLSKKFDWPLTIDYKDGGFGQLISVLDDEYPLYYRTNNKIGIGIIHADEVHHGGNSGLSLNGENMIVGVWDAKAVRRLHELFGSINSRVSAKDSVIDLDDHATHVTGTIIGSAVVNNGNTIGVAPEAKAYTYDWKNDFKEMIDEAEGGLLVSNHSYGISATDDDNESLLPVYYFGQYDKYAQTLDEIIHNFEYYLPVYAVGNDRTNYKIINPLKNGYDLLTAETNSKNNLVVGSISKIQDTQDPSSIPISNFSNFGPTDDGRIKPDITAKGELITSAISTSDIAYGIMSGTSMATPFVTGSILLIQQHAKNTFNHYLKSATVRGLIIHSATKAGTEGNPNYRFGWGVMNVERAVDIITNDGESTLLKEMKLSNGQGYLVSVYASEVEDLVGTIVWTELPGTLSTGTDDRKPVLVNDLDLRISEVSGNTYYPYILDPENPEISATTGDNFRDNVEKIEIPNAEGEYNISISHKGFIEGEEQNFSLILSGIVNKPLLFETYENDQYLCADSVDEHSIELLITSDNDVEDTVVSIEDSPQGVTATLDNSNIASGVVTLNISGLMSLSNDTYSFKLKAVNGSDEVSLHPTFNIINDSFEGIELIAPENGSDLIKNYVRLSWSPPLDSDRVVSYIVEFSLDEDFTDLIDVVEDIEGVSLLYRGIENRGLVHDIDYYWRVKAFEKCGESVYSDVFVFHTYELSSIEDLDQDYFVIYPNPATNQVVISALSVIKEVKVINMIGQVVMVINPDLSQVLIDISTLASGNYFLRISDEGGMQVKRLMKK